MKQILEHVTFNKIVTDPEHGIIKMPAFMWHARHKDDEMNTRTLMATPDVFMSVVSTPVDGSTLLGLPGLFLSIKPSGYPEDILNKNPDLIGKEIGYLHYDLVVRVNKDVYMELAQPPGSAAYNTSIYDMFAIALGDRGVGIKEAMFTFNNGFGQPKTWKVDAPSNGGLCVLPFMSTTTEDKLKERGYLNDDRFVRAVLENHIEVDLLDTFSEWS